jgi:hypothetical protein
VHIQHFVKGGSRAGHRSSATHLFFQLARGCQDAKLPVSAGKCSIITAA